MTESDRPRFGQCLIMLGEIYREEISPVRAEAYFDALADLPVDAVIVAVRAVVRTRKFFPKPSEIRKEAWSKVPTLPTRVVGLSLPTDAAPGAPSDPEHARLSFRLIRRIMKGELRGAARVAAFRWMAEKFPGLGWEQAVTSEETAQGM